MLKKSFIKIFPIIVLILIFLVYFYMIVIDQNIFKYTDQELTLSYNGYLLNNGIAQEYTDHPALFNIFLTSIVNLFQISYYNFPETIELLNNNISENIERLILSSRISNFILFSIFIILFFIYLEKKIVNRITSIFLIIFFISSYSVFIHTLQYRSEFLGIILLLVSFIFLEDFFKNEKFKITYFIFYLIFFYFSLLNKTQIIFYYPLYLILFFSVIKFNRNEELSKLFLLLSLTIIPLNFFYYYKIGGTLSFYFNTSLYLSLNIIFFIFLNLNKINAKSQINILSILNLLYGLISFLLLQIVKNIEILSNSLFSNINNPLRMLVFTNNDISQKLSENFFSYMLINVSNNFLRYFYNFFISIDNCVNILLLSFLILLTILKKKYKLLLIVNIGIVFQLIIGSITLNRYLQPHYLIYIDLVTIFLFIFIISNLKIAFKNYIIVFFIILNLTYIILNHNFSEPNFEDLLCNSSFLKDFQSLLNYERFKSNCY